MNNPKTILLTGATGFLGSNLLKKLIPKFKVIITTRSSTNMWRIRNIADKVTLYRIDSVKLEDIFHHHKIDIIVHCATNYGRKEIDPVALLEANLILPLKLLQLGSKNNVSRFINSDTILDKGVSFYSLSKSQLKEWLKAYSNDINCINIALEHFYGPYDDETKFVTYIVRSILDNVEKIDLTRGEQKRDFIYIDDVVDAYLKIINCSDSRKGFSNYEIGTNHPVKIRQFVESVKRIAKNTSTKLMFGALPYRKNEIMEYHVNNSNIKKLGWKPKFSLQEGLRKTIKSEKNRKI